MSLFYFRSNLLDTISSSMNHRSMNYSTNWNIRKRIVTHIQMGKQMESQTTPLLFGGAFLFKNNVLVYVNSVNIYQFLHDSLILTVKSGIFPHMPDHLCWHVTFNVCMCVLYVKRYATLEYHPEKYKLQITVGYLHQTNVFTHWLKRQNNNTCLRTKNKWKSVLIRIKLNKERNEFSIFQVPITFSRFSLRCLIVIGYCIHSKVQCVRIDFVYKVIRSPCLYDCVIYSRLYDQVNKTNDCVPPTNRYLSNAMRTDQLWILLLFDNVITRVSVWCLRVAEKCINTNLWYSILVKLAVFNRLTRLICRGGSN